jgi:hypothetical protein
MAQPLVNPLCELPLLVPLADSLFPQVPLTYLALLFAWCDPRPPWSQVACKLTSPSPFPPRSNFPTPQGFPKSIVGPSKTTSRHRLHIARNTSVSSSNQTRPSFRHVRISRNPPPLIRCIKEQSPRLTRIWRRILLWTDICQCPHPSLQV